MKNTLLVGVGGIIGSLLRYSVVLVIPDIFVLWIVNGVGSFLLGWLSGRAIATGKATSILWTTGILGSFTTFSTFSAEWLSVAQADIGLAILYALLMTVWSFILAAFGMKWGRGLS
ncbi:fluoride efflux transporter FluC [Paenisporosarcina indica]|uniref:fluoride efflux transporter FluC n=1 Tax=Paenisporosarcina indica TaxID=650093 RepID=UPI00094F4A0A|nr:CrcB family protein [Paenisporosarcina indica]